MIDVEDKKEKDIIEICELDEEIQKQFKQLDEAISFGNKMLIAQPFIFIGILIIGYILGINQYKDFLSYIFLDNGMPLINTSILACNAIAFFSIANFINKKKIKTLKKEINKILEIQKKYELNDKNKNKTNSIYVTDINNNIEEFELPQISITNNNNKNKPKTRTLKKDNNNIRK